MNEALFKRVQIAGLFIISFLGSVAHMLMHSLFPPEAAEAMMPWMKWFMVFYFALLLLPSFLALVANAKAWRWITAILGALMVAMVLFDSLGHMFQPDQLALGLSSFLIGGGAGVVAVILAFKWALAKESS